MFDVLRLARILELHEKSFALLRWVRASLKQGKISFAVVHQSSDTAGAAEEWIRRHLGNIPAEARPPEDDVGTFAKLFVSFLVTSYRLKSNSVRLVSPCGCYCSYCSYLQAGPNLEVRTPSKKDFATARELKCIYLRDLVRDQCGNVTNEQVDSLLSRRDLCEEISQATWGRELLRRSEYTSQGEAVFALWREFAWQNGSAKRKFKVTARSLMAAEQTLVAALVERPAAG
ncbi:MAG: hypothetical protein V4719_16875 [Planctomycetota bacterium]